MDYESGKDDPLIELQLCTFVLRLRPKERNQALFCFLASFDFKYKFILMKQRDVQFHSAIFPETFVHREDIRLCSARCNTHWWLQVDEEGISGPNWHPPDAPAFQVTLPCNLCLSTALPGGNRDVREQEETSWHIQLLCHCRPSHLSQSLKQTFRQLFL